MKKVKCYYIDVKDGRPASEAPLRHGPVEPSQNLEIDVVDRRETPSIIYGQIPSDETLSAGMTLLSDQEYNDAVMDYRNWKAEFDFDQKQKERANMIVSRFQARAALRLAGLREQVETYMADPATDPMVVDAWTDAMEFKRLSPTVEAMGADLGLTDEQLDDLFEQAAEIEA